MENHGGTVRAENLEKGARFTIATQDARKLIEVLNAAFFNTRAGPIGSALDRDVIFLDSYLVNLKLA